MSLQKAAIAAAFLIVLGLLIANQVTLNRISERVSSVELRVADMNGNTLATIEHKIDALGSKLP